jgi:hypothetical protein
MSYQRQSLAVLLCYHLDPHYLREAILSEEELLEDYGREAVVEHAEENVRRLKEYADQIYQHRPTVQELRDVEAAIQGEQAIADKHRALLQKEAA